MFKKTLLVSALSFIALSSIGCGKVCDELETRMCTDLGPEDCKIWKEDLGGLESIRSGRKADKNCGNIMLTGGYDTMVENYKKAAVSIRESRAPKE